MKKSFSLIELIFTIVIIALIFTTIPKIMYSTNQSFEFTLKEDGIFNMIANTQDIANQEWDENNTDSQDYQYNILITGNDNVLECKSNLDSSQALRVGGFYSGDEYSRICPKKCTTTILWFCMASEDITTSHIGTDSNEDSKEDYDDEDDFNATETNVTKKGSVRYKIYTNVYYTDEWSDSDYDTDTRTLTFRFTQNQQDNSNIKLIKQTLYDVKYDKNISHARYWGANIGKIQQIESDQW